MESDGDRGISGEDPGQWTRGQKGWEDFEELWELWKSQPFSDFEDVFL